MALITHQMQGSYANFSSRPSSWTKGVKLKPSIAIYFVGRTNRCTSLKRNFHLSLGAPHIHRPNPKSLKVSAFKGNTQNEESGSSRSKLPKDSVKLSYAPDEGDETITKFSKIENVPLSCTPEEEEAVVGSPAIQKLFKKWLMMLRTQSTSQTADKIFSDGLSKGEIVKSETGNRQQEANKIIKAAWSYFWGLDAIIKIPLLIFIPLYMAINVVYGQEVSKELTPLWILGPLICSLYIKVIQLLCALYVFCFKKTVEIVKNLPFYCLLAYNYVAQGKLKEEFRARFWQPVVDIKNLDYKEVSKKKVKEFEEWAMDKYLDYVESIWPYYCRTIRFLKRANLL